MFRRKNPLFRSGMEPRCAYCQRAVPLDDDQMMCRKRGVVPGGNSCRAFRYDPLRRVRPKPATLRSSFTDADFSLEDD